MVVQPEIEPVVAMALMMVVIQDNVHNKMVQETLEVKQCIM